MLLDFTWIKNAPQNGIEFSPLKPMVVIQVLLYVMNKTWRLNRIKCI